MKFGGDVVYNKVKRQRYELHLSGTLYPFPTWTLGFTRALRVPCCPIKSQLGALWESISMTTAVAAHQIGRVCANPPSRDRGQDKDNEFVEVISGKGSLAGHRLQHVTNPKSQNPHWKDLFEFSAMATFGLGTQVIVHSGRGTDGYDNHGHYHYYLNGSTGQGSWKLNNDGDTVRLLDIKGVEISRRVLQGNECEGTTHPPVVVPPTPTPAPRVYGDIDE